MDFFVILILFAPLLSAIANGVLANIICDPNASKIAVTLSIISAVSAMIVFTEAGINQETTHIILCDWITTDALSASWSIYVDQLTSIMFVLITIVSTVVHIYSLGYMKSDKSLPKFLSYLSFFTFFMLALVSADNFLQLFFGWEGVGVCSYLLIGYYYTKDSANNAAIKAFLVNRIADFAFIIGIVLIILFTGNIDFEQVFAMAKTLSQTRLECDFLPLNVLDLICLMLFIGCMGKSAQLGLHVWLPDAMEGPTPVSALIHAATMVTAGVFLIARCSFLFEHSPAILNLIMVVGSCTCLFAALIAIAQTDLKKIIAYSTCSQLGYMFFACGASAYHAGIFHLVTHGFFKALLFLAAGNVIHACHEQDIFKMGGLRHKMPFTYAAFWIGSLAIIGIFPFAGFYSKDLVLESAYGSGGVGYFAFALGIIAAILTAIYSLKIIVLVFHKKTKLPKESFHHAVEAPKIMNAPLILLIVGTLFAGMVGHNILNISSPKGFFLNSLFVLNAGHHHVPLIIQIMPLIVGILGMIIGIIVYYKGLSTRIAKTWSFSYHILKNKFFFDEVFNIIFVKSTYCISAVSKFIDLSIIDRFGPRGFSNLVKSMSYIICKIHTGYLFNYTTYSISAIIICITILSFKAFLQIGGL